MAAETGSAREEAERLVAAVLAMAGHSTDEGTGARLRDGLGNLGDTVSGLVAKLADASGGARTPGDDAPRHVRYGWATGSLECCVCPVCRAIAGMRDPNPRSAERLATGAGDMAMGVASLMRGLSTVAGAVRPAPTPKPAPARRPAPDPDTAWSAATRAGRAEDPEPPIDEDESPWAAATRAEARVAAAARAAEKAREVAAAEAREAAAAERARNAGATDEAPTEKSAPAAPRAPRPGEDVWAAATAGGEAGMAGRTRVDHDEAGDEAPGRS